MTPENNSSELVQTDFFKDIQVDSQTFLGGKERRPPQPKRQLEIRITESEIRGNFTLPRRMALGEWLNGLDIDPTEIVTRMEVEAMGLYLNAQDGLWFSQREVIKCMGFLGQPEDFKNLVRSGLLKIYRGQIQPQ